MPSNVLRACDSCHAKKIKCDRKDPCGQGLDSAGKCTRERPRYSRQAAAASSQLNDGRFEAMVRRLSYLEDVLASKSQDGPDQTIQVASESAGTPVPPYLPRSPSPTETRASQTTRNDVKEDRRAPERESSGGGSKRRRLTDASQPPPGSTQSSQDDEPCTAWQSPISRQAQHFLKGELGRSQLNMTQERERLFQSVLALAERVDMPAEPTWADRFEFEDTVDFDAQCMYPAPEFLYVTLDGLGVNSITTRFYLQLGRHLSKLTLERMEYALIENTVHGQRRLEYIICVNFWAYLVLTSLESEDPSTLIAQHLGGSRDRYFNNAKCALKRMSILATPTLSMLQALLCGVMFFLDVGDFEKCWILNAAACQAFVAIGGQHLVDQTSDPASTQAREVRASLFNCFVFDKAFSINMDRPCSMPEMEIDIPTLALSCKDEAVYDICVVLLELGKAMDALMKERRRRCEGDGAAGKMKRLQAILDSLDSVKEKVDQASHSPCQSENFLRGEWMSMEFAYYSVRGSILSMIMVTENDADTLQLRLASARRALTALKSMQDNTWAHFTQSRAFASSLTWTTLLFPFSALFLVFSNVVITGDLGDLRLLKDVGDGFSVVATGSPTISKIEDFCKRLVKLCFEAINKPRQSSIAASAPSLAPQPISDRSSAVPGPRRLVQNASRVRDMGNTSARQPTSAADAAAIPRPQFPTNLDNMDFVFGMDSLGMLDGTAGPLLFENNEEERIWQLYETHFDAFASEL